MRRRFRPGCAHRVIAIDHYPHRLDLAKSMGAEVINFEEVRVREE
jgi:threonine dehydrogenase-like Zn-dependent dehydrogenase